MPEPVELRVEVRSRETANPGGNSFNVIAEIPGTDPALRDEIVLIGAHMDSWHTSNGATDNGDGSSGTTSASAACMTFSDTSDTPGAQSRTRHA